MTWNGTDITGVPTFIYHDELVTGTTPISDPNGPGRLICRSSSSIEIHWAFVRNGYRVSTTGNTETVTLLNSNSLSLTSGYANPELQPDTGNIIYLENRKPIQRASDQTEDIKVIIEF